MTITTIVIPADPQEPYYKHEIDPYGVTDYREVVGGNLDVVRFDNPEGGFYINDEGKVIGLPVNKRATAILWAHNPAFLGEDYLAGNVVMVGVPDEDGYDTSAPESLLELLFDVQRFRIEVLANDEDGWIRYGSPRVVFKNSIAAYMRANLVAVAYPQIKGTRVVSAE